MAVNYNDFLRKATTAGMADQFDDDDLRTAQAHPEYGMAALSLKQDGSRAQTEEQKMLVNTAAQQLKNSYGLTGTPTTGTPATGTQPTGTTPYQNAMAESSASQAAAQPTATQGESSGSFSEGAAQPQQPAGNTMYAAALGDWQYDPSSDRSYQEYRKQYLREADRGAENTMGMAAAASAGRVSSYAANAAQQAGDYYRGQLTGMIPQLEQNAYQRMMGQYEAQDKERNQIYSNLITTISNTGYMPTAEEMARAGMTEQEATAWRKNWAFKAVQAGQISPDTYFALFGEWPNGYGPSAGGDDWGGGGGGTGNVNDAYAAIAGAMTGGMSREQAVQYAASIAGSSAAAAANAAIGNTGKGAAEGGDPLLKYNIYR